MLGTCCGSLWGPEQGHRDLCWLGGEWSDTNEREHVCRAFLGVASLPCHWMVERVKGDWRGDCLGADLADLISRVKGEAGASDFVRQEASRRG